MNVKEKGMSDKHTMSRMTSLTAPQLGSHLRWALIVLIAVALSIVAVALWPSPVRAQGVRVPVPVFRDTGQTSPQQLKMIEEEGYIRVFVPPIRQVPAQAAGKAAPLRFHWLCYLPGEGPLGNSSFVR